MKERLQMKERKLQHPTKAYQDKAVFSYIHIVRSYSQFPLFICATYYSRFSRCFRLTQTPKSQLLSPLLSFRTLEVASLHQKARNIPTANLKIPAYCRTLLLNKHIPLRFLSASILPASLEMLSVATFVFSKFIYSPARTTGETQTRPSGRHRILVCYSHQSTKQLQHHTFSINMQEGHALAIVI